MSIDFGDVKRRFEKRQALRQQGKVLFQDALYELQEEFGVPPMEVEDKLRHARAVSEAQPCGRTAGAPVDSQPPKTDLAGLLAALFARPAVACTGVHCAAPQDMQAGAPLGLIPALFVTQDGSRSVPGEVEVTQLPKLSATGVMVMGLRIPPKVSTGATAKVSVLFEPEESLVAGPVEMNVGIPQVLPVEVPGELRTRLQSVLLAAADDATKLDWGNLRFRFKVQSAGPPPEELSAASDAYARN